ncbi:MAG: hypothetical protein BA872_06025 [Desulfobacterales bacterium C00003060]|nr:MAG: hypothetical protein BA861_00910 [Desulfobacterales bacterium S3730MH5]OEU78998.1 MAG: hypothetical protein BA865_05790 [Desulfobacterales bacterium S5133MH4]OEU81908.1 MAG: hypothetical protein BA872_06025 [Desulfobacterales bacterium C00003060]
MTLNQLFDILDLDKDGQLSRSELHLAAQRMRWHWHEAPIFALLDLLTILKPIPRNTFIAFMNQIAQDPLGPYGKVLLNAPHFSPPIASKHDLLSTYRRGEVNNTLKKCHWVIPDDHIYGDVVSLLKHTAGTNIANDYQALLNTLDSPHISIDDAALLLIDPQRSFSNGVWMQSIGSQAKVDVKPIQLAFNNCAQFLNENYRRIETMFTRCPFPPDSYDWDNRLAEIIDSTQLYFIKPGNSVLFPPTNGFREWVKSCINSGKNTLVMGGCTLNSCIRVSSIETQNHFKNQKLRVVVDLSLSGARTSNFISSPMYGALSAVESAVREMIAAGVLVVRRAKWIGPDLACSYDGLK